ncbi:Hsp20/alpha crystallin family protein [Candidatus Uhrbacteria bacterium]|nr:Hsp20/alpha crystallin family protein [Candidatus Uhrbacteria bacterium]
MKKLFNKSKFGIPTDARTDHGGLGPTPPPPPQPGTHEPGATLENWLAEWENVDWLGQHGELAVDVFETQHEITVKSAVAGVKPADLDISVSHDILTIRGKRHNEDQVDQKNYLFQECHWGSFSRTVVLPHEVAGDQIKATLKNGILTIKIPKVNRPEQIVKVEEVS